MPAYQWLFGRHDIFLHHKRRYTSTGFLQKARAAMLSPLKVTYFNTFLFPVISAVRLKEKLLGGSKVIGTGLPHAVINKFFKRIFGAERFFLKHCNFPFGVSLLCILEKTNTAPNQPT